jgi:DNA-binding transcriptional ArsR family regulator
MSRRNPRVRDAMSAGPELRVDVVHGPRFELLVGLYAAASPDEGREASWVPPVCPPALAALGERSGELWLHLLGLALELPPGDLAPALERVPPLELRRHLLGVHVPAWCTLVGARTLERAARGDEEAAAALLAHPRYYAGRARESLGALLPLSPAETKKRVLTALHAFAREIFAPCEAELVERLSADARAKRRLAETLDPLALIDDAAGGFVYEPEPEFERVVLIPHVAARPWLLLCQHRRARLICYPIVDGGADGAAKLLALGRALGDANRIAILDRLRAGDATLAELADELALARSTTHHHLGQLRAAGLIALRGNARSYRYTLDRSGFAEAQGLLDGFGG